MQTECYKSMPNGPASSCISENPNPNTNPNTAQTPSLTDQSDWNIEERAGQMVTVDICGGLGNQIWQVAAAFAVEKKSGGKLRVVLPLIAAAGDIFNIDVRKNKKK